MAIAEAYTGNNVTISNTQWSLTSNSSSIATLTTDGVYQVWLDCTNMTSSETYILRIKEKVTTAGSQMNIYESYITGKQTMPCVTPTLILTHGWDITLIKSAGTDRAFSWSIRQVA